jgi:hypothetical protein
VRVRTLPIAGRVTDLVWRRRRWDPAAERSRSPTLKCRRAANASVSFRVLTALFACEGDRARALDESIASRFSAPLD